MSCTKSSFSIRSAASDPSVTQSQQLNTGLYRQNHYSNYAEHLHEFNYYTQRLHEAYMGRYQIKSCLGVVSWLLLGFVTTTVGMQLPGSMKQPEKCYIPETACSIPCQKQQIMQNATSTHVAVAALKHTRSLCCGRLRCSPHASAGMQLVCTCQADGFSTLEVVGRLLLPGDLVLLQAGQDFAHDAGGVRLALHGQLPPPLCHQPLCWAPTALPPTCIVNGN